MGSRIEKPIAECPEMKRWSFSSISKNLDIQTFNSGFGTQ
jgi:hypothetical protein